MRSGVIDLTIADGTLGNTGIYGYNWSSRGSSTHTNGSAIPSAYYLYFGVSDASPSRGLLNRWYSRSLRCLSTVLDI